MWCGLNDADTLHWRHNVHDSVSNHQPLGCLLNRLFRRRSKKRSKLRVTGLCVGPVNSPHKGPITRNMFPFDAVTRTGSSGSPAPRPGRPDYTLEWKTKLLNILNAKALMHKTKYAQDTQKGYIVISAVKTLPGTNKKYSIQKCNNKTSRQLTLVSHSGIAVQERLYDVYNVIEDEKHCLFDCCINNEFKFIFDSRVRQL